MAKIVCKMQSATEQFYLFCIMHNDENNIKIKCISLRWYRKRTIRNSYMAFMKLNRIT